LPPVTDDERRACVLDTDAIRIPHHDVLWRLDQAIASGHLAISAAAAILERMLTAGARLPTAEVRARLQAWR
jgi:hypothetical protein